MTTANVSIVYHYPCPDGGYGALMAHLYFSRRNDISVRYVPFNLSSKPEQKLAIANTFNQDDHVYLIDCSGGIDFIRTCLQRASKVTILDHHKSAKEDIEQLTNMYPELLSKFEIVMDMSRSGCMIAKDYFKIDLSEEMDYIVRRVQDFDLWKFEYNDSRAFSIAQANLVPNWDFTRDPDLFNRVLNFKVNDLKTLGFALQNKQDEQVNEILKDAKHIRIQKPGTDPTNGTFISALYVILDNPDLWTFVSILGNKLAEMASKEGLPPIGVVFIVEKNLPATQYKMSMRSIGETDVSAICRWFGGGGHMNSSACTVERTIINNSY